jgi:hypothetical protein
LHLWAEAQPGNGKSLYERMPLTFLCEPDVAAAAWRTWKYKINMFHLMN